MSDLQQGEQNAAPLPIKPIGLTITETMAAEKCSRCTVYVRIANGEYDAFKDGAKTFLTIESIERRRAKLKSWSAGSSHKRPPPRRKRRKAAGRK
jgi:hypothetical protein